MTPDEISVLNEVYKGISEHGILIVISGIFLFSAYIVFDRFLKSYDAMQKIRGISEEKFDKLLKDNGRVVEWIESQNDINKKVCDLLKEIREGATKESTIEQIKIVYDLICDTQKTVMYNEILRVIDENHLDCEDEIIDKVNKVINKHLSSKKNQLYHFMWKGKPLSEFKNSVDRDGIYRIFMISIYPENKEFNKYKVKRDIELFYDEKKDMFFSEIVKYNKI